MYVKHVNFIIYLGYIFRHLYGHHQDFHLNHVIKTVRTLLGSQLCSQNFEITSRLRIFIR